MILLFFFKNDSFYLASGFSPLFDTSDFNESFHPNWTKDKEMLAEPMFEFYVVIEMTATVRYRAEQ